MLSRPSTEQYLLSRGTSGSLVLLEKTKNTECPVGERGCRYMWVCTRKILGLDNSLHHFLHYLFCRVMFLATCSLHWREDLSPSRDGMAPMVTIMHYTKVCASVHTNLHRIECLERMHNCGRPSTLTHAKTPNTSLALGRIGNRKKIKPTQRMES